MRNKIVIAVVAFLLLGAGGYYIIKGRSASPQTQNQSQIAALAPKTLKDLLGLGTSQKCSYPEGIVYVAAGKIRGDFSETADAKTLNSHMIVDGNTSYIWTDDQKTGFKTTFDANMQSNALASPEAGQSGAATAEKPQDYSCEGWTTDPTMFNLPTGVTFQDISSIIPSASPQTQTGTGSSSQCSFCDSLSGSDKTQCLTALNCK